MLQSAPVDTSYIHRLIYLAVALGIKVVLGGVCWEMFDGGSGLCMKAFYMNMNRSECCSLQGSASVAWSPHTATNNIFYLNFLARGAPQCQPCHTNCSTVTCGHGRECRTRDGGLQCVCSPICLPTDLARGRLCGTDGRPYKNSCVLEKTNCLTNRHTGVEYYGKCRRSCKRVDCGQGWRCLEDQNGLPHCVRCDLTCTRTSQQHRPVCGVDGNTYINTCQLKAAVCRTGKSIRLAYDGPCNQTYKCSNHGCPSGQNCLVNPVNGQPVCATCNTVCLPTVDQPVCGTDGRTYSSYCHMTSSACSRGVFVTTRRNGLCKEKTKKIDQLKVNKQSLKSNKENEKHQRRQRRKERRQKHRRQKRRKDKRKQKLQRKEKHGTHGVRKNTNTKAKSSREAAKVKLQTHVGNDT
ncbi:follistatin-like [Mya arenaria]|uniref:follistatin-like n=1 Tax=Mya arenaria TaxID=6604 RepID=UPI0022E6F29D|nr:follistatin-like [Mya arenaria]